MRHGSIGSNERVRFLSMWSNEIRNHNFLKRKLHLKRRFLLFLEMTVMIIFVDQQGV